MKRFLIDVTDVFTGVSHSRFRTVSADALIHAVKGETDEGLLFCGAKAWKATRIETVKEVIESFF